MIIPRMELPEGRHGAMRTSGRVYTDFNTLLTDAHDTYVANPGAEVLSVDDPAAGRVGVEISLTMPEKDRFYWWQFWISIENLKKHSLWERMKTAKGRQQVVQEFVETGAS